MINRPDMISYSHQNKGVFMINKYSKTLNALMCPQFVHIEITEKCPLSCPQCYVDNKKARNMSYEQYQRVIEQIDTWGIKTVLLTGGEPILHPYLIDFVRVATNKNMRCELSSSGMGLSYSLAKELGKNNLSALYISLNGSTESVHNCSRSNYTESIRALHVAVDAGLPVGINWVARNDNIDDFKNIIKLAQHIGVKTICVLSNKPSADGILHSAVSEDKRTILVNTIRQHLSAVNCINIVIDTCYPELSDAHVGILGMPMKRRLITSNIGIQTECCIVFGHSKK